MNRSDAIIIYFQAIDVNKYSIILFIQSNLVQHSILHYIFTYECQHMDIKHGGVKRRLLFYIGYQR